MMIADRIRRACADARWQGRKVESVTLSPTDARAFEAWAEELILFQGPIVKIKGIAIFEGIDILEFHEDHPSAVDLVDVPGLPRSAPL